MLLFSDFLIKQLFEPLVFLFRCLKNGNILI